VCVSVCKRIEQHKETFSSRSNCKREEFSWKRKKEMEMEENGVGEGGRTATTFACAAIIHPLKGISMRQCESKESGKRRRRESGEKSN